MDSKPDLNDLEILCAVVDRGSFRAAADYVGTSQPTVSRAIARLEVRLDRPLVRRNSRSVAPTQFGHRYAAHAREVLRRFAEAEATLLGGDELAGPLSLSAPPELGRRLLVPALAAFSALHPSIRLDVNFESRRVDLIDESVDVAIRFGPLPQTWRRRRPLWRGEYHLYGSARFADMVQCPVGDLLERAPCLVLHSTHLRDRWPFVIGGQETWHDISPALKSNDVGSLIEFAKLGAGITLLPDFMVRGEVERGELIQLTASAEAVAAEVLAVTAQDWRSAGAEALLEHLSKTDGGSA